jgi:hypothetical protein
MEDLLQHIDLDFYRSAQLLIARAEIAELRRQSSASARTEQQRKTPVEATCPAADFDQTAHAASIDQSGSPEIKSSRARDLDH